jgi:hypothetical protein
MAQDETQENETEDVQAVVEDDNEPIYYKPKVLSLISAVSFWLSWVVIVLVIVVIVAQAQYVSGVATQNATSLMGLLSDAQQGEQARLFVYSNMLLPLLTGISFFMLLQAASVGLNALLEIDFNLREPKA